MDKFPHALNFSTSGLSSYNDLIKTQQKDQKLYRTYCSSFHPFIIDADKYVISHFAYTKGGIFSELYRATLNPLTQKRKDIIGCESAF